MSRTTLAKAVVGIVTYSSQTKSPMVVTYTFDLTDFRDPMGSKELMNKCKDGQDVRVREWIKVDPRMSVIMSEIVHLVKDRVDHGGGKWITFGFRDHHGRWKSRAVGEIVAETLSELGYEVGIVHAGEE